jgi:hypothetical protein
MSDIKITGPKDAANTLSFDGQVYNANKKGVFTVPVEALALLSGHGFTAVGEPKTDEQIADEARLQAEADAAAEQERLAAEQKAADELAEQERIAAEAATNAGKSAP